MEYIHAEPKDIIPNDKRYDNYELEALKTLDKERELNYHKALELAEEIIAKREAEIEALEQNIEELKND